MRHFYPAIGLILILMVISCSRREATPLEYVQYVENSGNGLKLKQEINGVKYLLQYQPTEYCVMLEERSFQIPDNEFKKEYNRFKGLEHFVFKIDKDDMDKLKGNLGDTSRYARALAEYFDFGIQKDIKLLSGKDTIPCSLCQRDAITGISPYYTYTLGFANTDEIQEADRVLLYQNKMLHTGKVLFCVKEKNIDAVPSLKTM